MAPPTVTVVVLGDIGRSPRMQYHAQSFLKVGYHVNVVGYGGSKPDSFLSSHNNCRIKNLPKTPEFSKDLPIIVVYLLKIIWQMLTLSLALLKCQRPRHLLVQTPPAIPAMAVCWLYCKLVGARFVIDWHNYGFSIMALTHGKNHKLVAVSEAFEGYVGAKADGNLCVTKAMKEDLMKRWKIKAVTLYDRPPEHFDSISAEERQALMSRYSELSSAGFVLEDGSLSPDRPGLLVSSTSWTEDEEFSILFSALKEYDRSRAPNLPKLICIITGKGPLKEHYMNMVSTESWSKVRVISLWLEAEDYPRLLASADLGVSLHASASGLDLPMKVVDMLGCGLPVAALHFPCLNELVQHQKNGLVFHDGTKELAHQLQDWFKEFPSKRPGDRFKKAITNFQSLRWHDNWKTQAFPLFNLQ